MKRPELPCLPPWWARGGHLQTVAANYLPDPSPDLPWQRTLLTLEDGDRLALRLAPGRTGVAVLLFHGLGGSAEGHYMRRAAALAAARGHAVLACNHRGAGEGAGLAAGTYHSGATRDLAAVLAFARTQWPDHRHLAVGFSISANIALLLAGRDAHLGTPDGLIAVNPPADLAACGTRLGRGFNRVYDQYFVRRLRREVAGRPGGEAALAARTLAAFDDAYTSLQAGFRNRAEYYAGCSCGPHLGGIRIPAVVLSAADDPFAPGGDLERFPRSESVHLHVEATGGHMGYLSRNVPGLRWLEYALGHYLDALA